MYLQVPSSFPGDRFSSVLSLMIFQCFFAHYLIFKKFEKRVPTESDQWKIDP